MEPFHNNPTKFQTCDHCKSNICKEKNACLLKSASGVKKNVQGLSRIFDSMIALARDGDIIAQRSEPMRVKAKEVKVDGRRVVTGVDKSAPVGDNIVVRKKKKAKTSSPTVQPSSYADDLIRHKKAKKASKKAEGTPYSPTSNPRGPDKTGKERSKTPKQPPIRVKQDGQKQLGQQATVNIKKGKKEIAKGARAKLKTPEYIKAEKVLKRHGGVNKRRVEEILKGKNPIREALALLKKSKRR